MKKQRINLNLLYDHDPNSFMANGRLFVEQIGQEHVSDINLFLSELQYVVWVLRGRFKLILFFTFFSGKRISL